MGGTVSLPRRERQKKRITYKAGSERRGGGLNSHILTVEKREKREVNLALSPSNPSLKKERGRGGVF